MLAITAGGFEFTARFEEDAAPETVAAFRRMLPLESKIIHVRWSGEGGWIPMGDLDVGIGPENATRYPSPGELIFYPGGVSETELLLAYGYVAFASKAGALAGNHFATIVSGSENLRELGRRMLWEGAQDIVVQRGVASRPSAAASTSTASATSSSEESSSGEWLTPPFRLRTKSIPRIDAGGSEDPSVMARTGGELDDWKPTRADLVRERRPHASGSSHRLGALARLEADRLDEAVERRRIGRPRVDGEASATGDHIRPARLDVKPADGRDGALDSARGVADAKDRLRSRYECVLAAFHRRRPRMPRTPFEDELAARVADDARHDSERRACAIEHRSLLDVQLEERRGQRPAARAQRTAPDAADLLAAERDDRPEPARSTASIAATTPSAPSKRPPCGTVSRCEPSQTSGRSAERPSKFPEASCSTSSPASRIQPAASSNASSSAGLGCGRLAPGPPPIAYSSSSRSRTRTRGA